MYKKPELLAPAGSLDKLISAITYGADAVYLGGQEFSMRTASKNFSNEDLIEGVKFAHENGAKVYVAINIVPRSSELERLPKYLKELNKASVDAVIVSDLGVLNTVKEIIPNMEIHISTQANITNYQTAMAYYNLGAKRVVLARELTLDEILEIRQNVPDDLEIECFVHGAMCMSYSGRCLLSNYLTGRDSNRGNCAHPCRWKYSVVEETRPGEYMPVYESEEGSYIFNSKDMCMIEHIDKLYNAGINSFKIEGRVKTSFYVSVVTFAYRKAIDNFWENKDSYTFDESLMEELRKVSHREYFPGFYFDNKPKESQRIASSSYIRNYNMIGEVLDYDDKRDLYLVKQKNKFVVGEEVEIFTPDGQMKVFTVNEIFNENFESINEAPHPEMTVYLKLPVKAPKYSFLRKKANEYVR